MRGYFGRARVSARRPEAAGVCDRCGFVRSRRDLVPQMRYAGAALVDSGLRVCPASCLDIPNPQFKTRFFPADPVSIPDPRPGFNDAGPDQFVTQGGDAFADEDGDALVKQNGA